MKNSGKKTEDVKVEELTECSECKSEHIVRDYKRGEITCRNCGLVVDDKLSIKDLSGELLILNKMKGGQEVELR